jgi:hypothetical protein
MMPLHRPLPEPPTSRPLPLALDAPTVTLTDTIPLRLTPPVTLPPPADDTRVPDTEKGKLLLELQLPRSVANKTFQVPSKAPAWGTRAGLASAISGATSPARAAATKIHREAGAPPKSVERAVDRTEIIISSRF